MPLLVDHRACSGCMLCETGCSLRQSGACDPGAALLRVERVERTSTFFVRHCAGCESRACLESCPCEALAVEPRRGTVRVDADRCSGCGACVSACPWQVLQLRAGEVRACDLCAGAPECALLCPGGALRWVEEREASEARP
jgi:Fe-S-cluster-containing dehydrogenase component